MVQKCRVQAGIVLPQQHWAYYFIVSNAGCFHKQCSTCFNISIILYL